MFQQLFAIPWPRNAGRTYIRLSSPYSAPKSWTPPQPAAAPSLRTTKKITPWAISLSTL
jgi:hypothetical protein